MLYLFLAQGFEELEAVAPLDLLRRAELDVLTVGVGGDAVTGVHGITVKTDLADGSPDLDGPFDGIILPGGMPGTLNLEKSAAVQSMLGRAHKEKKLIAAICAAPLIPGRRGYLRDVRACCFPGFEDRLEGAVLSSDPVCADGNVITAKGAGAAVEFGLGIVRYFCGQERARLLASSVQMADR